MDHSSCGYEVRSNTTRANRIEWEHVVPAHTFGHTFPEWKDGHPDCVTKKGKRYKGRRCAAKVNDEFKAMEADPVNLVPAVGEVNANRSNYPYAIIPGEVREYGSCDVEISNKQAEPRPGVRGDIARIYMYMDQKYPGRGIITDKNRSMFEAWSTADPVSDWEIERNRRILEVFGVGE